MARPLRTGSISFGLVTVPIGLVSAIEAREELAFNLLHKKDRASSALCTWGSVASLLFAAAVVLGGLSVSGCSPRPSPPSG